ncbi:MAG TPA: cytochrome c maturation protein CcmE [Kofleriaceae bacterium]|nr:cytochrome c maturation protein CcmE [Kofleriaceae bacterium]
MAQEARHLIDHDERDRGRDRDRAEVVATGQWHGEVFVATELMAKCPDTYEPPKARPDTRYR